MIYQEGKQTSPIKISLVMWGLRIAATVLSWGGTGLILISIFGLVFVYIPLGVAEINYEFSKTQLAKAIRGVELQGWKQKQEAEKQKLKLEGKMPAGGVPDWVVPDKSYSIYIPKIYARSKVISNVDAGNSKQYLSALQKGVAEAAGLSHPGEIGTTYLFAHSVGSRVDFARYNAVFYLLDKLTFGDPIEVVYQNSLYKYEVVDRKIVEASDIEYLIPQKISEKLVLQTCYPPGTTWKRLVVIAKRKG